MSRTVKWAIIGCGIISSSHADALKNAENAELYAACDIISERAENVAAKYGAAKVFTDYKKLLEDPEVDVVSICTPSGLHGEMIIAAAKAGKSIFCEKPMEITAEKMDAVIEAVEKADVKMGCVFQRRVQNESIAVKAALDSGRFGKIILADAYLKYYRSAEYYKSADWRATWELDGGGSLMNQGIHGIDLLLWLAGDAESLFARCSAQLHDIEVEDTAVVNLRFKNGALGVIEGTTCVYPAQDTRFEIHCEKGSIIFGDAGIVEWKIKDSDEKAPTFDALSLDIKADPTKLNKLSHLPLIEDMADAVLNDRQPLIGPREARKAVDVILAIYKSSKEKREIFL